MQGMFVVMKQFCVLIVVAVTLIRTCDVCKEVYLHIHIHTSACKIGKIRIRSEGCANISFLVLILYYSYVKCYHRGKLDEGYMGPLCTIFRTSCESIIISK